MERRMDGGYGWVAVGSAFTAHFIGFGVIYSFTIFFPEILGTFGVGRGTTSWIPSIAAGLLLGAGGITGRLSDRFGPGLVLALGGVLVGSGLLLTSWATAIWQVYLAYGFVLGLGVSCAFVPSVATVGQWFERKRGLAIGVAVAGTGIGSLVFALVSSALIQTHGWRVAARVVGVAGAVSLVLAGSVLRPRVRAPRGGGALAMVRGDRRFRLLFAGSVVASYGYWVPFVHIVPFAEDRGITKASAAVLVSIMGLANTFGRVVMGATADRVGRLLVMRISSVGMAITLFVWPFAHSWRALALFGALYSVFAGSFIALLPALAGDYFGMQRLAGITGLLFSGAAIGTLFGAPVTGLLFDARGSYALGIWLAAASMTLGTWLMLRLDDPRTQRAATQPEPASA